MADSHKNFAYSTVATAPNPTTTGTSLVVQTGDGTKFPSTPFNATVWPANSQPTVQNAEIVRVTAISTDTFTITRNAESSSVRNILVGDQIAATVTVQTLKDVENSQQTYYPFYYSSASATTVQSLATGTGQSSSGSLYVFPLTVMGNIQFNQAILPMSISYTTSNAAGSNSYYSYFGLYTMNGSTALSLYTNGSFSIAESMNGVSRTWSYPTTTMTSGYGYGTLAMSTTAQIVTYISGTRAVGLQFGSDMRLSNGVYWMGIVSVRSTAGDSGAGLNLSTGGVIAQIMDPNHSPGTVSGYLPIGSTASNFSLTTWVSNSTAWWGRHLGGFVTATSLANFGGTTVPASIHLSALAGVAASQTITAIPAITFYSINTR